MTRCIALRTDRHFPIWLYGVLILLGLSTASPAWACAGAVTICFSSEAGSFPLVDSGRPATLIVDADADPAVIHAAKGFAADLQSVSGNAPQQASDLQRATGNVVIVGMLGRSAILDRLVRSGKIRVEDIAGRWEAYRQIVVDKPAPGIARALVIAGSDRRGAVYGLYDISEKMGVSPWQWWADVPVKRQAHVFVTPGARTDQPKVRYRGFFINDEAPAFNSWTDKHFGGRNAKAYAHVFELLLRLKGNYLWPAMWAPNAFNDDDPQNMVLADAMGVVMGTSHHEPLMRAQDEWHRNVGAGVTGGKWDYVRNAANLRAFWRGGIERMMSKGDGTPYESLVTVGMRGDGDEAMAEGTATDLLEKIVADQRSIIADVTGKPADRTPQVWALYKEVQDYYDKGMTVPDDVILLFADDNWGQIRRLPAPGDVRKGGYGVYYHFDYVGAPRNYKWLNTTQIEKTWQQMDLAYARGARSLWIVNVGDIKPMEFPLSFFMKQAWNPEAMTADALHRYPAEWAKASFGVEQGEKIADLITRYSKFAARRKPELIDADSFPLGTSRGDSLDGGDFGERIAEWTLLEQDMEAVKKNLSSEHRNAFYQLVEHPITALSNLYQLYYAVAWNRTLAAQQDARANIFADRAEAAYRRDQAITDAYHALNGGKWDGMMAQTHIGYTGWQQPDRQTMPQVVRIAGTAQPVVFAAATNKRPDPLEVVVEAPRFARSISGKGLRWTAIPHLGKSQGAVVALPQGRASTTQVDNVRLDYNVTLPEGGTLMVQLHMVPTLDITGKGQQRIGLSIDDRPMQTLTDRLVPAPTETTTHEQRDWNKAVENNERVLEARFGTVASGRHVVKLWRLDDNMVVQKIVARAQPVASSSRNP